jgi:excisionase family DNA binding protein
MANDSDLLNIKQAARLLNVTETSLRRWTNEGRLACFRIGAKRERRFRRADLLTFLEEQPARGPTPGRAAADLRPHTLVGGPPLAAGTHLCSLYATGAGRTKLAAEFLIDGLKPDSVCYLVATPSSSREVLRQINRQYPTVDADIESGRLIILQYRDSGAEQLELWETQFVSSLRRGARTLRVVGNVSEAGFTRAKDVINYEQDYDRLLARRFPLVTLCQYDARRHPGVFLSQVLKQHPDDFRYPQERLIS